MFKNIKQRLLITYFLVCAFFLLTSLFITNPLIFHLSTKATGVGDELLLSWIQTWVSHIVFSDPLKLFDAPSFFPFHNSLAYSDSLISSSIIFYPFYVIFHQPIVFQNATLITSLWLLGFSSYLLCFYLFRRHIPAIISGLMVVFSPVVLDKYVHLQVLFVFFVPLAFLSFMHYLKSQKKTYLILAMLCFILQTLNSFLPGYFIIFGFVGILLAFAIFEKKKLDKKYFIKIFFALVISIAILIPFILPYYKVSSDFAYTRDIRDSIHFALQPEDLYYANSFTRLSPMLEFINVKSNFSQNPSFKNGYPGLLLLIGSILSIFYIVKNWKKERYEVKSLFIIGIGGLILSLGPFLHIGRQTIHHPFPVPLPYLLLYYLVPGFNGLRNSARWEVLFVLCMSILAGYYIGIFFSKYKGVHKHILAILFVSIIFVEYKPSFHLVDILPREKFPQEYHWLSKQSQNAVVVEMPVYNWNTFPYATRELQRQYYSTAHFLRTVNGASGFSPPPWQLLSVKLLKEFPSSKSIDTLKNLGVNFIIVHFDEYDLLHHDNYKVEGLIKAPSSAEIKKIISTNATLREVVKFDNTVIYVIK
ncbi:MAG: hypothetical protein HZC02_02370 [Candidatus Levybacteria bacterium]|nr:hypothetical protein [Candidatus Levybacteria bacterium]